METYSRGWRGAPAKGVDRATGARVQIPLTPPFKKKDYFSLFLFCKVIYKSVYENNFFNDSLASLTNSILDLYSDVDGITTSIDTVNKKTIVSIEYDYTKIDIEKAQEELKELLSDEAVLMNMEDEITVEEYLDLEDSDYICK